MTAWKRKEVIGDCTLYLGDCLEVMPELGKFDAVVTDPPYGIANKWKGGFGKGWSNARKQAAVRNKWDESPLGLGECAAILNKCSEAVIWGGNYFPLPPSRCWLVWNKPERGFTLAEAELAWTNLDKVVRVIDAPRSEVGRVHPTQKPVSVMEFSIGKTNATTILDPFMGSGTTGVACVKTGRKFTGIELDEDYFNIACERIQKAYDQPDMFVAPPEPPQKQEALL